MNVSLQFLVALLFFLAFLALGYRPWFLPKEYIVQQKKRKSTQKKPKLLPHAVTFSLFQNNPQLELWFARIIYLLGVLIGLVIMLAPLF